MEKELIQSDGSNCKYHCTLCTNGTVTIGGFTFKMWNYTWKPWQGGWGLFISPWREYVDLKVACTHWPDSPAPPQAFPPSTNNNTLPYCQNLRVTHESSEQCTLQQSILSFQMCVLSERVSLMCEEIIRYLRNM